jgi:hypothetical protein
VEITGHFTSTVLVVYGNLVVHRNKVLLHLHKKQGA